MEKIKLLIVEDEDDQIEVYEDSIKDFNNENEINFIYEICRNEKDALFAIENKNFDAAFIDLSLSEGTSTEEGRNLLNAIQNNSRYPIFVVSGQIQNIAHEFNNSFISKHDRSEVDTNELLINIKSIYEKGITKVLNSKGLIENHLNKIFWNQFSRSRKYWDNHFLEKDELEKVLSRYTLMHLLEYFQLDDKGQEIKVYDPAEMYIKPYIKETIHPGLLVKNNQGDEYLVLTPACDISQNKCDCLILVKLIIFLNHTDLVNLKDKIKSKETELSKMDDNEKKILLNETIIKDKEKFKNLIRNYISNNKGDRYYFLPEFIDFNSKIIDFQNIQTIDIKEIGSYEKIMTISTPFMKDIQAKFSSYYARQGSPDFDFKYMTDKYSDEFLK